MTDLVRLVLGLVALPLYLYVPGACLLNSVAARSPASPVFSGRDEWIFNSVVVSVLTTGLAGFMLAEAGLFSWWSVLLLDLIFSLGVQMWLRGRPNPAGLKRLLLPPDRPVLRQTDRRFSRMQAASLLVLLVIAAALFTRPAEMLRGALDSGVYVNSGVALGRTGAIFQRDTLMRQLNDDAGEGRQLMQELNRDRYTLYRLRMPGFYVYDKQAALVVPQHYSLFPVWIGLLYSLFGIWGALYASPLLALISMFAVYFFGRRAFDPAAALLALLLLILCPVTIWFARYPVAEVLTGLLAFCAFYGFVRMVQARREQPAPPADQDSLALPAHAEDRREPWTLLWATIAGVALGEIALARSDFIFYLLPVVPYLVYWRLSRKWTRAAAWFVVSLGLTLALFLVHFFFYSFGYTLDLYHNVLQDVRRKWGLLLPALYLGLPLLFLIDRNYGRVRPLWVRLEGASVRYRWAWAGIVVIAVAGFALYQYAIGPWLPNVRQDDAGHVFPQEVFTTWQSYIGAPVDLGARYNLLRVGWYLSPLGVVLGVLGLLRFIWNRLNAATGLFVGVLLILSYIFIRESYTDPHYIYTMRRYVPVVVPGLLLGFAWACQFLWTRVRPRSMGLALAALPAVGLCLFFVYTSRTIISHVEESGAVAQLTDLASRLPEKSVVLLSHERDEPFIVATPLQYVFGRESFVINKSYPDVKNTTIAGMIERWRKQGYSVWVMMSANGGKLNPPGFTLKEEGTWDYDVPEFEQLRYQKPYNVSRSYLPWGLYSIQPGVAKQSLPFSLDVGGMDYKWLVAGFYLQEKAQQDKSSWRWTGDHAVLRLPLDVGEGGVTYRGASVTLRLRPETPQVGIPPLRAEPVRVKVSLNNTQLGEVVVPAGSDFTHYSLKIPPGVPVSQTPGDGALLHIDAPTWTGMQAGISYDQRVLGIQVDEVTVSR
ncbi:MAG TPA: hypothetical protein VM409_07405 [Chloroflexia bacterium]|nr:hypothetical protein [Chloroflexia bacterium]